MHKTVFLNEGPPRHTPSSVLTLLWDPNSQQFFIETEPDQVRIRFESTEELMRAISERWTERLPHSHTATQPYTWTSRKNRLWAPTIEIFHTLGNEQQIMQVDDEMDSALRIAGTLAQAYIFIRTPRTAHLVYALVFHSIQQGWHKPASSLWDRVCDAFNAAVHPGDRDTWSHYLYIGNVECGRFSGH